MVVPRPRLALARVRQMMSLVEHEEREAPSPALEERERRVVGGHRERAHVLLVAVPRTDALGAEGVGELREPLRDERPRGRDDAGARPELLDREEGDEGLP